MKSLTNEYMPNTQANANAQAKQSENVSGGRGYSSWFYWRRNEPKKMSSDPGVGTLSSNFEVEPANQTSSASTILEMPDDTYREGESIDR